MGLGLGARQVQNTTAIWKNKAVISQAKLF